MPRKPQLLSPHRICVERPDVGDVEVAFRAREDAMATWYRTGGEAPTEAFSALTPLRPLDSCRCTRQLLTKV